MVVRRMLLLMMVLVVVVVVVVLVAQWPSSTGEHLVSGYLWLIKCSE